MYNPPFSSYVLPFLMCHFFCCQVQIGNYRKTVGNLLYLKFWKTQYFIGIMCGIGAFIILVIVVAVIISCYRHRKSQQGLSRSQPKDSERIVTASDNHYTQCEICISWFSFYILYHIVLDLNQYC